MKLADIFEVVRDAREAGDPRADDALEQAGDAAVWYPVLVAPPRQLLLRAGDFGYSYYSYDEPAEWVTFQLV